MEAIIIEVLWKHAPRGGSVLTETLVLKPGPILTQMERIARRAPGSADMRAALAALYYDRSGPKDRERAEGMWNFACDNIAVRHT